MREIGGAASVMSHAATFGRRHRHGVGLVAHGRARGALPRYFAVLIRMRRYSIWPRSPSTPIGPVGGTFSSTSSFSPFTVAVATPFATVTTISFQSCGLYFVRVVKGPASA